MLFLSIILLPSSQLGNGAFTFIPIPVFHGSISLSFFLFLTTISTSLFFLLLKQHTTKGEDVLSNGFLFDDVVYISDISRMPEETLAFIDRYFKAKNSKPKLLVLDCLHNSLPLTHDFLPPSYIEKHGNLSGESLPTTTSAFHPTHFHLGDSIEMAKRLGAEQTLLSLYFSLFLNPFLIDSFVYF